MTWLEENIEPEIREVVALLRENGINTECSCGHKMYVQCQYILKDGTINSIYMILYNAGYRDFRIEACVKVDAGHAYNSVTIYFKENTDGNIS